MFFRKKSIDSIISNITEQVEQLHAVSDEHHEHAEVHDAIIAESTAQAQAHRKERDRAKGIAGRLTSLIS